MKKTYLSPRMKVMKVQQTQFICGSVNGTFGISKEAKTVEKGDEGDWSDTNLTW